MQIEWQNKLDQAHSSLDDHKSELKSDRDRRKVFSKNLTKVKITKQTKCDIFFQENISKKIKRIQNIWFLHVFVHICNTQFHN